MSHSLIEVLNGFVLSQKLISFLLGFPLDLLAFSDVPLRAILMFSKLEIHFNPVGNQFNICKTPVAVTL